MSNKKKSVALSSVFASLVLTVTKLVVGMMTGSMGIISEAAHSLLDLGAAILTFFAVKYGDRPADDTHPYGHGKIESVSALIETGLLFVTSAWIIYEAIHRLISKNVEVDVAWYAFAVIIFSIVIDISRSRALSKVAKETNSQALEADALHFSSDIWSSAVVLVGLVGVSLGIKGADAIAAIGVAVFVVVAGYRLGKRTVDVLVDTAPEGIADMARDIAKEIPGVINVNKSRVRSLGPNMHIEVAIDVSRKISVSRAHDIKNNIKKELHRHFPNAELLIHASSIQLNNETIVEAVQALAAKHNIYVHDVVVDKLDDKKYISYDVEVLGTLSIKEAHEIATDLEKSIKEELGGGIELNSHIEPLRNESVLSSNVSETEMEAILSAINEADKEISEISDIHNVLVRKIGDKFFASFHCLAPADISLDLVHESTNKFEYLMKSKMKDIKRVVIHVAPIK